MYYDDESRRFNVLSGLLFGTLLGAGIALLAVPRKGGARAAPAAPGLRPPRRRRRKRSRGAPAGGSLKAKLFEAVAASVVDALKRAQAGGPSGR